ncbi:Pls/PosA family non-ribosomal peptide synthetase [Pseudonocardia xishanensis]|uniref:Carrier domain-containing protein n=1 Tax=Pseudonocardia xishanensis TaxID=630995 RepID=A0ABP8RNS0_9PSEU
MTGASVDLGTPGTTSTPSITDTATTTTPIREPTDSVVAELAAVLAGVLGVDRVAADAHFFDDLGADSMTLARFCAKVRKDPRLPAVAMRDVYDNPTLGALALALTPSPASEEPRAETRTGAPSTETTEPLAAETEPSRRAGCFGYVLCGAAQLALFLGYIYGFALVSTLGYEFVVAEGTTVVVLYERALVFGAGLFVVTSVLPIALKWVLVGRWRPREIRLWSLDYLRFWLVRTLVRANPLLLLVGGRAHTSAASPLTNLYLRALGARIGRGATLYTRSLPVCTDLIEIGEGAVVRKDAQLSGYRARGGVLEIGPVTIGRDALVGEAAVLDIHTGIGDGAVLGHASALQSGQSVPAGETWHGVPAERGGTAPARPSARCGPARRVRYGLYQLLLILGVYMPLTVGGIGILLDELPRAAFLDVTPHAFTTWQYYVEALAVAALAIGLLVVPGLLLVAVLPRLLNLGLRADRDYPLYGFRYGLHRTIGRLTNVPFFTMLFGDSSYIVGYLRWIGYDLDRAEQTGSNFGTVVRHETPFHVSVGRGTMVADGLSLANADFSATGFRISRTTIGARCFLGNVIAYPTHSRVGDDCLLATKVLVPTDGPVRTGTGLLGAPSFPIPRTVERDVRLNGHSGRTRARLLRRKNRHNLRSMGVFLTVRWLHLVGLALLALAAADLYRSGGVWTVAAEMLASLLFSLVWFTFVERAVAGFRRMRPRQVSIYDPYFWWHERFWKCAIPGVERILAGTPFKNVLSRALGVRIGRRVFDDGCMMPEHTLVSVGDEATLNAGSVVQCHSQEDGSFKSDRSAIGARATLGPGAFVHYGVQVGDGAELAAATFLMKGEEVPAAAGWEGNPARPERSPR